MNMKNQTDFEMGQRVKVISDNENYDTFRDKILIVTDAQVGGIGYDDGMSPELLMCFKTEDGEDVPFSLYEYEVECI